MSQFEEGRKDHGDAALTACMTTSLPQLSGVVLPSLSASPKGTTGGRGEGKQNAPVVCSKPSFL